MDLTRGSVVSRDDWRDDAGTGRSAADPRLERAAVPRERRTRRATASARRSGPGTRSSATSRRGRRRPTARTRLAAAITAAVEQRNLRLLEIVRERDTGVRSLERPGLSYALVRIAAGEARALVVSDIRNLCRSIVDLGSLVRRLTRVRAALIALDLDIDTTTSDGRAVAEAVMTLADWEHDRIARRTRTGLARTRARGRPIGPPGVNDTPAVRDRIAAMRAANMTLQAIADTLNADGRPDDARRSPLAAVERAERTRVPAADQIALTRPPPGDRNPARVPAVDHAASGRRRRRDTASRSEPPMASYARGCVRKCRGNQVYRVFARYTVARNVAGRTRRRAGTSVTYFAPARIVRITRSGRLRFAATWGTSSAHLRAARGA